MNFTITEKESIDLSYMDLIIDGDKEMKIEMLQLLMIEPKEEIKKLWELLAMNDYDSIAKVCHKMKSTLAFVGNDTLTNINFEMNRIADSKINKEELKDLITLFETLFSKLLIQINNEYQKLAS